MTTPAENLGTVLIVDDDPAVLVLIQNILMGAGYRVLPAAERTDVTRLVGQKHVHIDVALLDVRLPGVNGTELADEILTARPNIRILWMSGFVDEEFIRIKLLDGYAGFLPKPLRRAGLLMAIEQAMTAEPSKSENSRRRKSLAAGATGQGE